MSALIDALRGHAAASPDAIAIDGAESLSWSTLTDAVSATADALARRFDPARPVALRLDYGVAETVLDLAFLEASVPTLALPAFFTEAQAAHAVEAAGAQTLVTGPLALDELGRIGTPTTYPAVPLPEGTARITFTSGSTGAPKGLCLSRDHLLAVAGAVAGTLGPDHAGRHLALLPPGILLESVAGLLATMLAGGCYVALPQAAVGLGDPFRPDFAAMLRSIAEEEITSLILVPEYLAGIVAALQASGTRLPRLTVVAVGGARMPPTLLDAARALGLPVRQGYGLTECASVVTLDDGTGGTSVGRSLGVNRVALAPDGEVLIEGPLHLGPTGGPPPTMPLATGDLGRMDADGRLTIEGRKSALIVTSFGRNVSPEWVEGVLTTQPAIAQALVRGDGRPTLDALIVPATPQADVAAAVAAANAALPPYARIAGWRAVAPFTPASGLLSGNGRLRRAAIDAAYPFEEQHVQPRFFDELAAATAPARARFAETPQLRAGLAGEITRGDYLAYLAEAYHHVRHTVPLMQEARARLGHRPDIVAALDDYIAEESGHEAWILADIAAAGGDAAAVEQSEAAPATRAMVDHAYRTVRESNPIALFGMVYVLETVSIALATQGAAAVQRRLNLPDGAFRYLTSHGALDQEHLRFFANLMDRIDDPRDRAAIVAMADSMFDLFGGLFAGITLEAARVAA